MKKIRKVLSRLRSSRIYFLVLGFIATLWFLVRVIPKPSRATYPCMRAAAPIMSSFIIYLLAISGSVFSFRKFRQSLRKSRHLAAILFLAVALVATGAVLLNDHREALARVLHPVDDTFPVASNTPVGVAKGLSPGRVVWIHDRRATNEYYSGVDGSDNYWFNPENTNEEVVYDMLEQAILKYAGTDSIEEAWDLIFRAFNQSHGRGDVGYTPGERIAFKINLTNESATQSQRPSRMDATPQLLNAILHQLVDLVGVEPYNITMGDPYRKFRQEYVDLVMSKFPDVYYVGGAVETGNGVHQTYPSQEMVLKFSDKNLESSLPQQYLDATYLINIPCLKTHNEGGITLIAKNHQGSYLLSDMKPENQYAILMHYSLPANSRGTKNYRHTVDYMGHKETGGKGLIYIIDGLWAGEGWEGWITKFRSAPFDLDYPNTLLVGQDPVALESVGFDILFQENVADPFKKDYPITYKAEIADYLKQCASSDYWPAGIQYDPEGDGTPIESLGVFEHWNNPEDRKYSRNLGTGEGVELLYFDLEAEPTHLASPVTETVRIAAPNPFSAFTTFTRPQSVSQEAALEVYDMKGILIHSFTFRDGDRVTWDGTGSDGGSLPDGIYLYTIKDGNKKYSGRVVLQH
jgi:hypothetical protein